MKYDSHNHIGPLLPKDPTRGPLPSVNLGPNALLNAWTTLHTAAQHTKSKVCLRAQFKFYEHGNFGWNIEK